MRTRSLLLAALVSAVALAGCAGDDDTGTTTTTTTMQTTTTSTPPTTSTTTTPPTIPVNESGKGVAALPPVLTAPARALAGGETLLCWTVTGTGNVPHTAIHWDDESHPGEDTRFNAYDGGAVYPGNATSADPAGYDLPGRFCANVPIPENGTLYLRAHVIDVTGPPGKVSEERAIVATGAATAIRIVSAPATAAASSNATVCWEVTGSANVAHTAIHWDNESHPASDTVFNQYDQGAVYPGNETVAAREGYDLPGVFCGNVRVPASGSVYFRAHVIDAAGPPGRLSDEAVITVA